MCCVRQDTASDCLLSAILCNFQSSMEGLGIQEFTTSFYNLNAIINKILKYNLLSSTVHLQRVIWKETLHLYSWYWCWMILLKRSLKTTFLMFDSYKQISIHWGRLVQMFYLFVQKNILITFEETMSLRWTAAFLWVVDNLSQKSAYFDLEKE